MRLPIKTFPKKKVVDYKKFRDEIRSGDLLLCSGSAWFSKMIQKSTKSVWSHVGFVMRLERIDRVMVLESVESQGVRTVPLSKYLKDYDNEGHPYPGGLVLARHKGFKHKDFEGKVAEKKLQKFAEFAVDLFGYPYDKDEIAKIAIRIATSWLPFSKKKELERIKELKRDREYICSEYVWECYKHIGIPIAHDPKGFVAPADFARNENVSLMGVLKKKPKE
jgi:hypothetical protein